MAAERLRTGTSTGLGLTLVDLFAGTLLAVFVMFVIYVWIHQDPVSECFLEFQSHASQVFEESPEAFLKEPEFTFLQTRLVLNESWLSFEPCLWELAPDKQDQLRDLFDHLVASEFRGCVEALRIEGHADRERFSVASCARAHPARARDLGRIGPWEDNTQLSQNRARAVFETLRPLPFVDRMWSEHKIHIGGYGDSWPLVGDPASPLNRRVELHLKFYEAETRATELAAREPSNSEAKSAQTP